MSESNALPESLDRYLDGLVSPEEDLRRPQGTLRTTVRGSHVHITVSLRRWWSGLMGLSLTEEERARMEAALLGAEKVLRFALIAVAIYLACEIAPAFLRGGAVDRVLGGGR